MGKLPSALPRRPTCLLSSHPIPTTPSRLPRPHAAQQIRHATFIPRPRRPYQFTQLIQLSDGSTFTVRTTSPAALHKSAKDSRNHILWQPTEKSLKNVEVDEAGRLAAFRERFGRGFDIAEGPGEEAADGVKVDGQVEEAPYDLGDLISGYAARASEAEGEKAATEKPKAVKDTGKGKK